ENGETAAQGAARETLEEAGARIELAEAFSLISVPRVNQGHVFFRARVLDLDFRPGAETLEVALFGEAEVPWQDVAFRTVSLTLERWFADRRSGKFGFHTADSPPTPACPTAPCGRVLRYIPGRTKNNIGPEEEPA